MSAPGTSAPITNPLAPTATAAPGAFVNTPTPTQLYYANAVDVDLAANAVNFADSLTQGHRVQVTMPKADMNAHLKWAREIGSDRPVGTFADKAEFQTKLEGALTEFIDLDGVSSGLNLSAGILADKDNVETQGVNDLIAQYILYKVYGVSSYNTSGVVFNIADLADMTTNAVVSLAIADNLDDSKARGGAVDKMFRDLLSSDPKRFFDTTGKQIPGLFETNADAAGEGDWKLDTGDVIEIKVNFKFGAAVTRRAVRADQQPLAADGGALTPAEASVEQEIIAANEIFPVRLQLRAV